VKTRTAQKSIACIVLHWNSGESIGRCLQSLLSSVGVSVEPLVIDNGSTDRSAEMIGENFPSVTIIRLPENLGVAAGWNKGIRFFAHSNREWLFLMNSDATVEPDCLHRLLEAARSDTTIGAATPRVLDGLKEGRVWFDGGRINVFGHPYHPGMGRPPGNGHQPFVEDFGSGCALLIRREALAQTGNFDEKFFAYAEDTEFCVRARKRGWKILHAPSARAVHFPSSSVRKNAGKWFRDYYVTRNALLLGQRTTSGFRWAAFLSYFLLVSFSFPLVYLLASGQVKRARSVVLGVFDFVRGRTGKRYG
jgi:GT2 family glycosyltransferase